MHKRFFVLETRNHLDTMLTYMDYIHRNNPGAFPPPDKKRAFEFLKLIAEEYIADMAMFPNVTNFPEQRCRALFGVAGASPLAIKLMRRVMREPNIRDIVHEIQHQIHRHVRQRTWTEWKVIQASGILGVVEGKDHRVNAWEEATGWVDEDGAQYVSLGFGNPVQFILELLQANFGELIQVPVTVRGEVQYRPFKLDHTFVVALCADVMQELYPQLDFTDSTPTVSVAVTDLLWPAGFEAFRTNVISKILQSFGLTYLNTKIQRDRRYQADFTSMGMFNMVEARRDHTEREFQELVASYHRQDRLTAEETELVERWLMDHPY